MFSIRLISLLVSAVVLASCSPSAKTPSDTQEDNTLQEDSTATEQPVVEPVQPVKKAKLTPRGIFGEHMVLQRNSSVPVFGLAELISGVQVKPSWSDATYSATPDENGYWRVDIATPDAGGPYTMEIIGDTLSVSYSDILIGDVWFCSGQSNMEHRMEGFKQWDQYVEGADEAVAAADPSVPVRLCTVTREGFVKPTDKVHAPWLLNTSENVLPTSAVAYFFALGLQKELDVPIGVVISQWGSSPIEAWMSAEALGIEPYKSLPSYKNWSPTALWNGMVAPLVPFRFKGWIWYQGENNIGNYQEYQDLQERYAAMMREAFSPGEEIPFYFVQIAPYRYDGDSEGKSAYLREAQAACLGTIPHCGMVVTGDIGEPTVIHPAKKRVVADRLIGLALYNDYGRSELHPFAPLYKSSEVVGSAIEVEMETFGTSLECTGDSLTEFEIAGEDKVFYPAQASITGDSTLRVSSPSVSAPVAVRYCFKDWSEGNLRSSAGLPAAPFRSDNW